MKPLPTEAAEFSKLNSDKKKKGSYKRLNPNVKLTPEQMKAKNLARRLEKYAVESKVYPPHQINSLIDDVRGSVIKLNIQRSTLRNTFHNKRPRRRK